VTKRNPMWQENSNFNHIVELASSFQKSKVLFTAIELGLFDAFGDESMAAAELADRLNTDAHSTDRLLNALCGLGLISKKGALYSNSEASKKHLVSGSNEFIGSMVHVNNLWESWSKLTECIKLGKPIDFKTVNQKDSEWIAAYLNSLEWKAVHEAPEVIKALYGSVRKFNKALDLGAGSGRYSIELANNFPDMQITDFDYPNVIAHTKHYLEKNGLADRIHTIGGDCYNDEIGNGYDLVFISYLINEYSIWENIKLLKKVYDSLNKMGIIVLHQQIVSDDRLYPMSAVMESINMIVNTLDGDCYTETDVWVMLKESWFQNIERIDTDFGSTLIIGSKLTTF